MFVGHFVEDKFSKPFRRTIDEDKFETTNELFHKTYVEDYFETNYLSRLDNCHLGLKLTIVYYVWCVCMIC